jgi:hypothetical protein
MGPPLRSFATDAHDCIMVRVLGPTEYKDVARLLRAPKAGSPQIVVPTTPSVPSCSELSRHGLALIGARGDVGATANLDSPCARQHLELWVGAKKRASRSNKETFG